MKLLKKLVLVIFLFTAQGSAAQNIDIDILKRINPQYPDAPGWTDISNSLYSATGAIVFVTLTYGYSKGNKQVVKNGYELLLTTGINVLATELLKRTFNRTRPAEKYPGEIFVLTESVGKSMPSGHTSQAFAVATTLTLQYKKWYVWVPAYLWAGSVAYSRMYLGKHYPSDVLAGAAVGAASSYLGHILSNKLFRNKKKAIIDVK